MSMQADRIYELLKSLFPHNIIIKEYYVSYKGRKLFFDFYIKELLVLIEVQGRQHSEFIEHFHGDKAGFIESKERDNLKLEYCQKKNLTLLTINYDEKVDTTEQLIEKINKAMTDGEE